MEAHLTSSPESRPSVCSTTISLVAAALLALGVVMVFSAGASLSAPPITENPLKNPAVRQAGFTLVALIAMLTIGLIPYHFWRIRKQAWFQPSIVLTLATLALLVAVLIPGIGERRNGALRWLSIGPSSLGLGFQPSELGKLAVVVFTAAMCARLKGRLEHFWTGLLPVLVFLAVVAGLVGKEDFGTAALLLAVGGGMLVASRARLWHLVLCALPAIPAVAYMALSKSYRVERLMSFLHPENDPGGKGYHQIQSLITIVSGGWWGRGIGGGIQKYGYLPEARSDFIFAVICEELGVVGGSLVIALFVTLIWQGRRAMLAAPTEFGRLLALGATLTLGLQAAMNIAVVTVSVPTKGIALPLVSAGGTGVIILSALVGMLINVARWRPEPVTSGHAIRPTSPPEPGDSMPHSPSPDLPLAIAG